MTTPTRLAEAEARRDELRRELDGLAATRADSANSALVDLEAALLAELGAVEEKIRKIAGYLSNRRERTE